MTCYRLILIIALLVMPQMSGLAHDPATNPGKPVHGGQYVEHETHFGIELVQGGDKLIFHMTEHLQPKDMTGSSFKVLVQTDAGIKVLIPTPKATTLVVPLSSSLQPGAKIVLTGKDADKQTIQARFVVK